MALQPSCQLDRGKPERQPDVVATHIGPPTCPCISPLAFLYTSLEIRNGNSWVNGLLGHIQLNYHLFLTLELHYQERISGLTLP